MKRLSVSVVIPHYGSPDSLARALRSVRSQTRPPNEVVIVDDGSPIGLRPVSSELERHAQGLALRVHQASVNRGPSYARNIGWDSCSGDLVAFLDADDTWHRHKLEAQVSWLEMHPAVALTGHAMRVDGQNRPSPGRHFRAQEVSAHQLRRRNVFPTPSVIVWRKVGERFRTHKRYSEDYDLWLRLVHSDRLAFRSGQEYATMYKPPFGGKGLSGNLVSMSKSELENFTHLRSEGLISTSVLFASLGISIMKSATRPARAYWHRQRPGGPP